MNLFNKSMTNLLKFVDSSHLLLYFTSIMHSILFNRKTTFLLNKKRKTPLRHIAMGAVDFPPKNRLT